MRKLTQKDIDIFKKLVPELGDIVSPEGHPFPFILRPVSHRFVQSSEDFGERLRRLSKDDMDYLVGLVLRGDEDVQDLSEGDLDEFMAVVREKVPEKETELRNKVRV
ncbi:MAG TPA: hypothetical protein HA257_05890 [Candidatus Methanoperedenaceae archaeon]|nr:hypothetical protein [Candidatus Methanoperedenaceae archaeon]